MTVSSLWKALDKGASGERVGVAEILAGCGGRPPNDTGGRVGEVGRGHDSNHKPPVVVLAIDLSIWICEAMTSYGMNEQHTNPALYLVFTRVMKLRQVGIRLVAVLEGKQRSLVDDAHHRQRRSGTAFWKACNDCQTLLELLGVPVVKAKCEGEALCALLNLRGIVDGVISNDGDCLLFGAKVVYTKLTNENLDQNQVIRYRSDNLRSLVDASDEPDLGAHEIGTIELTRHDLVAFAILTGSDVAGDGLPKVGHKKAIRFIRKCHFDRPLTSDSAALEELESWARSIAKGVTAVDHGGVHPEGKCCSRCDHGGTKRNHLKHGCQICGTAPGEPCLLVTAEDRFRKSLREKALAMKVGDFRPMKVLEIYMQPNDNALPLQVANNTMRFDVPSLPGLAATQLIVKGRSLEGSRSFVMQSASRLLSRIELYESKSAHASTDTSAVVPKLQRNKPLPTRISRTMVRNQVESFEVQWVVHATVTDEQGQGIDGYEFTTVESQDVVKEKYPDLVAAFCEVEKERTKQGNAMQVQRRGFLDRFLLPKNQASKDQHKPDGKRKGVLSKKREAFFQKNFGPDKRPKTKEHHHEKKNKKKHLVENGCSDDVGNILRFACQNLKTTPAKTVRKAMRVLPTIHEKDEAISSTPLRPIQEDDEVHETPQTSGPDEEEDNQVFCQLGGYDIEITPVVSNHGLFPPRHIFVRGGGN
jgi:flap endonuclease GEN